MNHRRIVEKKVLRKEIKKGINKFLLLVIVYLLGMISVKVSPKMDSFIENNVFLKSFSFLKVRNIYDKYFSIPKGNDEIAVMTEKVSYDKIEEIENGVKLTVPDHFLLSMFQDGLIVFIGDKEGENTVVVDQVDGVSVEIKNIVLKDHKIYDYLEKGDVLGEAEENEIVLYFKKEGDFVSYKEYI